MKNLKKIVLLILLAFIEINAQWGLSGGENIIQASAGLGLQGTNEDIDEGAVFRLGWEILLNSDISLGLDLAVTTEMSGGKDNYGSSNYYSYEYWNTMYYAGALKLNYHFYSDFVWDFYVGGRLGLVLPDGNAYGFRSYQSNYGQQYEYYTPSSYSDDIYILIGPHIGFNVFFTEYIGMFLEAGYNIGYVNGGFSVKFDTY